MTRTPPGAPARSADEKGSGSLPSRRGYRDCGCYHPHIHCIVPGGGLAPGGTHWIPARRDFFLPVRVLSEVFRGKLLATLETALDNGTLRARPGEDPRGLLTRSACTPWVVYCKPPFAGAEQVLAYLGRYAHRVAISNDRLISLQEGEVTFRWKDRAHGHVARVATLDAKAFLRRFLLHVLPRRFIRIRHYGFLANAVRRETLATVRTRLGQPAAAPEARVPPEFEPWDLLLRRLTGKDVTQCPRCGASRFVISEVLPAVSAGPARSP